MRRTRRLFFIGLGLSAIVAVGSYGWQLPGLAGSHGIAPIGADFETLRARFCFFDVPSLLWLSSSDVMLHLLSAVGVISGVLMIFGVATRIACLTLWASWLSLVSVGHPFLAFQWDVLLVEAAFCAAFFAPPIRGPETAPHPAFRHVMIALACKVTLESGIVKFAAGDCTWLDFTALTYHWWSQPLPTWTSVLIAQLPMWCQRVMCAVMFVLELVIPLMAFGPRWMRLTSAVGLMVLQIGLFAAGNYSFYNLLAFVLAIPLLDDRSLDFARDERERRARDERERRARDEREGTAHPERSRGALWIIPAIYAAVSLAMFLRVDSPVLRVLHRFDTLNAYGAFAVMTKTRAEIIIEGSTDGETWLAYEFPWKPGDVTRRPVFVAPWQPRLDWQMWFAALGNCESNPWVLALQQRLLTNTPEVLKLFEKNPFPNAPPRFMRTRTFEYRFAPWSERGVWWTRTETGVYCPSVMLDSGGALRRAL